MQSTRFSPHLQVQKTNYMPSDYAVANNLTPFISMQNHYSLIYREEEREMFPTLKVRPLLLDDLLDHLFA